MNILASGAIMLLRYLLNPHLMVEIDRWLMGGIDVIGYDYISTVLILIIPSSALLLTLPNELNALSLGEEMAYGYGVNVKNVHMKAFIGGGILTAAIVSVAGPIGFVGLIIPHIVRALSGSDNRIVLPASFLTGAAFLAICDAFARTVIAPTEMPVGIITAVIGAPVFIRLLFKKS